MIAGLDKAEDRGAIKRYKVEHLTRYRYSQNVSLSQHFLHLMPRNTPSQHVESSRISVEPLPATRRENNDYFGNATCLISIDEEHTETQVFAQSEVAVARQPPPEPDATPVWEDVAADINAARSKDALFIQQYCYSSPQTQSDKARSLAQRFFKPGVPILQAALALIDHIYRSYNYDPEATTIATPVDEVMRIKSGVCQDFAHLALAALRSVRLPARYVSGYLLTHPPEGQQRLQGADASHAWLSIWAGAHGWIDLDPTNNIIPSDEHITVAWGRDYGDVSPINGVTFGGGEHDVDVEVDVLPL
ncbi:MAG: transglutaminase family protein [Pseudomonadota bacterium]